jgi:hypothetical protein
MTTTLIDRILGGIARAGTMPEIDDIDPAPDEFVQEALPLEDDEIPMVDAVKRCHEIADKMRMYE